MFIIANSLAQPRSVINVNQPTLKIIGVGIQCVFLIETLVMKPLANTIIIAFLCIG